MNTIPESYAADSKSIDEANRSTGNHSLACARVLQPCAVCHVNDQRPNDWLCWTCAQAIAVGASGTAQVRDDDPPADWLGLAVWCGLSVLAACVSIGALVAARALGWLS